MPLNNPITPLAANGSVLACGRQGGHSDMFPIFSGQAGITQISTDNNAAGNQRS